ncbi:MAG: SDR family oxidoreductase [Clostridiales bacterium]|nr:SDR family oxidoreductase [Clostridiales bacterium]
MKKRTAVVTGASSGIGREIAKILSDKGFDLVLCARREDKLEELKSMLKTNTEIVTADLSEKNQCFKLYEKTRNKNIAVLINCAGFGGFGQFSETDLEKELEMIDVNIKSLHILTKLYLKDFVQKDKGYILNVSSSAGLMPAGPYMSAYYATKAYVTSLTTAIAQELKNNDSNVYIGALCPGPVDTEFNDVAGVKFGMKSISAKECADYGIKMMFQRKTLIVPSITMKASVISQRFLPRGLMASITGEIQKRKEIVINKN